MLTADTRELQETFSAVHMARCTATAHKHAHVSAQVTWGTSMSLPCKSGQVLFYHRNGCQCN